MQAYHHEVPPYQWDRRDERVACISGKKGCTQAGSVFICEDCGVPTCWCDGGTDDHRCSPCWLAHERGN